jgi:hypothetical protein
VGDEENAFGAEADGVEGRESGLSETGGEDDEASRVAVGASLLEGGEGFELDVVGLGDLARRLDGNTDGGLAILGTPRSIALDALRGEGTAWGLLDVLGSVDDRRG